MKFAIILLILLVVGFIFLRRQKSTKQPSNPALEKKPSATSSYRSIGIVPGTNACDVAKNFQGQRLLPNEVESFPLAGCDKAECHCTFDHFDDRRDDDDRRGSLPRGFGVNNQLQDERRVSQDRRSRK